MSADDEDKLLRSVAFQNANTILVARRRAEQELLQAKEALEAKTAELAHSLSMMRATLESTTDGILVTDEGGVITGFNEKFVEMWQIPREVMESGQHHRLREVMGRLFDDSRHFIARVDDIYSSSPTETFDVLELANGKVVERFSRVQSVDGRSVGRVWSFRDITERGNAEKSLRENEERFRTLADNMAQLAWMADATGQVFWYNRRWFEYTGATFEEMQGWDPQKVLHPDHTGAVVEKFRHSLETGEPWEDTFPLRSKDGTYRWFLSRAVPIRDDRGEVIRWFGTNTDVTEQRLAELALLEGDRRKDEFLAVVAHELRNPLSSILMAARILQMKGPPDPPLQKLRDTIVRQTQQLSKLVDDLLDVGRITAGKLRLEKRRIDLNTLLKEAVESCSPLIERCRHTLVVEFAEPPLYVDVDAGRIVQVLCNLLNNASKYMNESGRIELAAFEEQGDAVIRVRDEGVGIPEDMLGRIFQRFVQASSSTNDGLGIGLSVVKALVELHGGSVVAASKGVGKGSVFTLRLPLSVDSPPTG